jgi:transposase
MEILQTRKLYKWEVADLIQKSTTITAFRQFKNNTRSICKS